MTPKMESKWHRDWSQNDTKWGQNDHEKFTNLKKHKKKQARAYHQGVRDARINGLGILANR